jgi:hypothetical protein
LDRTERDAAGIVKWSERIKEIGKAEGPTKRRIEMVEERQRRKHEQTTYPRIVTNAEN